MKVFKRILAIVLCAALLLVGGVSFLFRHELGTILSTTRVTDKFSTMNYTADYGLDEFLQEGASTDGELAAFVIKKLMKGLPVEIGLPNLGCSTFQAQTPEGDYIFGRNFDHPDAVYMLVHTKPETGYESISMVNMTYIGGGREGALQPELKTR